MIKSIATNKKAIPNFPVLFTDCFDGIKCKGVNNSAAEIANIVCIDVLSAGKLKNASTK